MGRSHYSSLVIIPLLLRLNLVANAFWWGRMHFYADYADYAVIMPLLLCRLCRYYADYAVILRSISGA